MYQAKAKGKGRFEFFDPTMAAAMLRRHDLKEELAKAIEREEILVEYQPIVSLETGRIVRRRGARALAAPRARAVPPSEFVPLAEETGQIRELGRHVLSEACRQARRWADSDPGGRAAAPARQPLRRAVARPGSRSPTPGGARATPGSPRTGSCSRSPRPSCSATRRTARRGSRSCARSASDLARRLRHRLLVAQLPPLAPARQPQDRQAVRRRADARRTARPASSA